MRVSVVASYGLELVEIGGTLARHVDDGDDVRAAVFLARPEARDAVGEAAKRLGLADVTFLDGVIGEVDGDRRLRDRLVAWLRAAEPDLCLMPDPDHAQSDLDPERRHLSTLALESMALAGRDWREDELGPCAAVDNLYYFACSRPTCVVDVTATFERKLHALDALSYQADYSAAVLRERLGSAGWAAAVGTGPEGDGLRFLRAVETAHALHHGAGGHGRAALAEAFRHADVITLDRLA